ncbi:pimeloyl-[acyl-carrier protein] methyl ester esterase [Limimonas halophila]|uniref:Pimeloyl-[acyl-carrier protein] methyl ester esterase n=1 Tax=Limimonas halophila TaxID=1082479 RepID=A0A1G7MA76_9PROT|nr:alpha/beta fold hydrolase [Limimonas halophila]SDF58080.1 pimeloyl-[acyl-carrier protein] methyl ester esterase [Limimonas halophila]
MTWPLYIPGWGSDACAFNAVCRQWQGVMCAWWDALGEPPTALDAMLDQAATPPVLVGWSLGGQLALAAAARKPHAVAGLVLVGTPARFLADEDHPGADARGLRSMRLGVTRDPERVLADFWRRAAAPEAGETADAWRERATTGVPRARLADGLDHLAETDLRATAAAVTVPAAVIHGRADAIVPVAAGERLAHAMPAARFIPLDGGHALPFSHPETIAAALTEVARDAGA